MEELNECWEGTYTLKLALLHDIVDSMVAQREWIKDWLLSMRWVIETMKRDCECGKIWCCSSTGNQRVGRNYIVTTAAYNHETSGTLYSICHVS